MLEVVKRHEGVLRGEHTDIDWDDYCMIVLKPFTALCLRALINSEKLHQNEEFSCIFANLLKLRETTGTTTCAIFFKGLTSLVVKNGMLIATLFTPKKK